MLRQRSGAALPSHPQVRGAQAGRFLPSVLEGGAAPRLFRSFQREQTETRGMGEGMGEAFAPEMGRHAAAPSSDCALSELSQV